MYIQMNNSLNNNARLSVFQCDRCGLIIRLPSHVKYDDWDLAADGGSQVPDESELQVL